ncbi:e3 ubiquitin-protein ligase sgr9 [Quercus suber]|uniref:RING-type E3 ubiquitin transferase n=1 Tax=Quercus suber TaxID=58331 RepID=A0AAW0LTC6_QUESU
MPVVVRDKATAWDVGLTHERLSRNNPSTVVFHLHPDSTHHYILRDSKYDEVQHQTQLPITRLIEILQQELLPPSLNQLKPLQREELVLQIIARAHGVLLDYSKYFPTVVNLLMRVYLNIVITYNVSLEFEGEDHTFTLAASSTIVALKEGRLNSSSTDTSCTFCLKDFPVGSSVICMTCSHIFHWQCIVEWLNNSHYYPDCLFKMPT